MRATVTIDVELCKGCVLCIPVCPPRVLVMSEAVNRKGYRYPAPARRLHRLRALRRRSAPTSASRCTASRRGARCERAPPHGRSAAIAEAAIQAGCRFYAGYPDHAVDRDPRVHVDAPAAGRRRVHERRERDRGDRHGVGRGRLRRALDDRVDRPGHQPHAGELRRAGERADPGASPSTWGAARATTSSRRAAAGTATIASSCSRRASAQEAVDLAQLAFHLADKWRNPVLIMGDFLLGAHVRDRRAPAAATFAPLPPKTWAITGAAGRRGINLSPIMAAGEAGDRTTARTSPRVDRQARGDQGRGGRASRRASSTTPTSSSSRSASRRASSKYAARLARERGLRVGFVRPITLWPFPTAAVAEAAARARAVAVFELNAGQMIEDVRARRPRPRAGARDRRHQPRPLRLRRRPAARRRAHAPSPDRGATTDARGRTHERRELEKVFAKPDLLLAKRALALPRLRRADRAPHDPGAARRARRPRAHDLRRRHRLLHRLPAASSTSTSCRRCTAARRRSRPASSACGPTRSSSRCRATAT